MTLRKQDHKITECSLPAKGERKRRENTAARKLATSMTEWPRDHKEQEYGQQPSGANSGRLPRPSDQKVRRKRQRPEFATWL